MPNFPCPACFTECYSDRLLQLHLQVTSCGGGVKAKKCKAQMPLVEVPALPLALKELPPPGQVPQHIGIHPVSTWTCDDYMCWCHKPTCMARLIRRGGSKCNCGNDWKSPLFDPPPPPPTPEPGPNPWPHVEDLGPLSFSTLIDRLADYYHRLNSESAKAPPGTDKLARLADLNKARVKSILVSRSAPDVTCLEGDRLLRTLGISLANLLMEGDQLPLVDYKAAIIKALDEIDTQLAVTMYAVEDSREVTTYLQGVLKARVGAIGEQVDTIRSAISRPEDMEKLPGDGSPARSREEYEDDLRKPKQRKQRRNLKRDLGL